MAIILSVSLLLIGVFNLILGIFTFAGVGGNKKANLAFLLCCVMTSIWCLGYSLMGISPSVRSAYIMKAVALIGILSSCPIVIYYTQVLSGIEFAHQKYFNICIALAEMVVYILAAIPISATFVSTPYGRYYISNNWTGRYLYFIYLGFMFLACIFLGVRWFIVTSKRSEKTVAISIIESASIMLVGSLFDTAFHIYGNAAFPSSAIATGIAISIMFVALRQHNSRSITGVQTAQTIFELAAYPVMLLDDNLRIINCNRHAGEYIGDSPENVIGTPVSEWISNFSETEHNHIQAEFMNRSSTISIETKVKRTGFTCSIDISVLYDKYGEIIGLICILNDKTRFNEMQSRIEESRHNAQLANATKKSFLENINLGIIAPIQDIISDCREIRDDLEKENSAPLLFKKSFQKLENIESESGKLKATVEDMLDIAQIQSGTFVIEKFRYDFQNLLEEVVDETMALIEGRPLEFVAHVSPGVPRTLIGDRKRLKQVIKNLLDNAAKYTEKGLISLSVKYRVRYGKVTLSFDVSDTGKGIREDELDLIFGPDNRKLEETDVDNMGRGLGLNICRNIVHMMNGEMTVKSAYGKGSIFSFNIEQKSDTEISIVPYNEYTDKVLILEESPIYAEATEQLIREIGLECTTLVYRTADESLLPDAEDVTLILISSKIYGKYGNSLERRYPDARFVPVYSYDHYSMLQEGQIGICGPKCFAQIKDYIK